MFKWSWYSSDLFLSFVFIGFIPASQCNKHIDTYIDWKIIEKYRDQWAKNIGIEKG